MNTSGISLPTSYLRWAGPDFRWAMKSGAIVGRGSSNWSSSSAGDRAVFSGGLTSGLSRFHGKTTLPRRSACSVSAAGNCRVASGAFRPAKALRIGSGQPVVTDASGMLMKSPGANELGGGAGALGAGAVLGAAGGAIGAEGAGFKVRGGVSVLGAIAVAFGITGEGRGEEGLMGGGCCGAEGFRKAEGMGSGMEGVIIAGAGPDPARPGGASDFEREESGEVDFEMRTLF